MIWLSLAACGELEGFGGPTPPLATFQIDVTGDFEAVRPDADPPRLRLAMLWGQQWLTEQFCITPPANDDAAVVLAAGCRDPLGFMPARVAANGELVLGARAQIDLFSLPAADVMIGDVTARIAFGTVVVYDDRDDDGTLGLSSPRTIRDEGPGPPGEDVEMQSPDRIYGASFLTMQAADQRIAFREGEVLSISAFYPRAGCGDPPPGFSVLSAGGFSLEEALLAQLEGRLPMIDPATCAEQLPQDAVISIALRPSDEVAEVACTGKTDSTVRYRDPARIEESALDGRALACVPVLGDDGQPTTTIELVVGGLVDDPCKQVTHFLLKGCEDGPDCLDDTGPDGEWDHSEVPPEWWPCG